MATLLDLQPRASAYYNRAVLGLSGCAAISAGLLEYAKGAELREAAIVGLAGGGLELCIVATAAFITREAFRVVWLQRTTQPVQQTRPAPEPHPELDKIWTTFQAASETQAAVLPQTVIVQVDNGDNWILEASPTQWAAVVRLVDTTRPDEPTALTHRALEPQPFARLELDDFLRRLVTAGLAYTTGRLRKQYWLNNKGKAVARRAASPTRPGYVKNGRPSQYKHTQLGVTQ